MEHTHNETCKHNPNHLMPGDEAVCIISGIWIDETKNGGYLTRGKIYKVIGWEQGFWFEGTGGENHHIGWDAVFIENNNFGISQDYLDGWFTKK